MNWKPWCDHGSVSVSVSGCLSPCGPDEGASCSGCHPAFALWQLEEALLRCHWKGMNWMLEIREHFFTDYEMSTTRCPPGGYDQQQSQVADPSTVNQMWWVITSSKRQQLCVFDHLELWLSCVIMTTCDVHMPNEPKNLPHTHPYHPSFTAPLRKNTNSNII